MQPATALTLAVSLALGTTPALAQAPARTRDVGFVATPMTLVTGMLELAGVSRTDLVYDLGSGDGRIVIAAARRGARAVGVELDSMLVEESRASADTAGVAERAEFRQGDLFATDLRPATVVTLYLGRQLNQRLRPIFLRDLRPGTRVVSQAFDMGDWKPDSVIVIRSREVAATPVHLWVIPAEVAGRWAVTIGSDATERLDLTLTQRYQTIRGSAVVSDSTLSLEHARLRGDSLAFSIGPRRFAGRVSGGTAGGVVAGPVGTVLPWSAVRKARR